MGVAQIAFRYDESTFTPSSGHDSVESTRIGGILNPLSGLIVDQLPYIYEVSCKLTSGMTTRHALRRVVTIRSNRIELTDFQTHPVRYRPYRLPVLQLDNKADESSRFVESSRIDDIFQPSLFIVQVLTSAVRTNRLTSTVTL